MKMVKMTTNTMAVDKDSRVSDFRVTVRLPKTKPNREENWYQFIAFLIGSHQITELEPICPNLDSVRFKKNDSGLILRPRNNQIHSPNLIDLKFNKTILFNRPKFNLHNDQILLSGRIWVLNSPN